MNAFEHYETVRNQVDKRVSVLSKKHNKHMQCAKGCDSCCTNFRLLPLEFEYIKSKLQALESFPDTGRNQCAFLVEHRCTIYEFRPIICRTHGLPILNMNEEGEQWELSFCELNFKDAPDEYFNFDNSYEQDTFNSKLYLANQMFIKNFKEYSTESLLHLVRLSEKS